MALLPFERRALVSSACRLLYVPTPKVLSTSMLWWIASAEGDPAARALASVRGPTGAHAIHDPIVHGLPSLEEVSRETRAEALTSPRWIRLGLTRDPFARLYAAWQYSVLLGTPGSPCVRPPDLVVREEGKLDVGASFRAFVRFLEERWSEVTATNQHFVPQIEALARDRIEYTDLAPIERLDDLRARLTKHAPALGRTMPRLNEGLPIDPALCYDTPSAAIVARLYRDDFEHLGYDPTPRIRPGEPVLLDELAQRLLHAVHERNRRLDMLRKGAGVRWEVLRRRHALKRLLRRILLPRFGQMRSRGAV